MSSENTAAILNLHELRSHRSNASCLLPIFVFTLRQCQESGILDETNYLFGNLWVIAVQFGPAKAIRRILGTDSLSDYRGQSAQPHPCVFACHFETSPWNNFVIPRNRLPRT
jgi:hypothetical protein